MKKRILVLIAILFVICGNVFAEDVQVTFISAKNNSKEIKIWVCEFFSVNSGCDKKD